MSARHRAGLAGLAFVVLALAGCTAEGPTLQGDLPAPHGSVAQPQAGGGPGAPSAPGSLGTDVVNATDDLLFPAPLWVVGESWRYAIEQRGGSGRQEFVVVAEESDNYVVGTTDRADAIQTAFQGRSLPGRVSKQFLSGYDVGLPTRFFDFPLQQNKTWNLHLAGLDFPVKANFSRNVEGGGPGFVVEGTAITGEHIRVVYSIDNRWMSRFALADETGRNLFTRTLSGHGNYSGRYFLAQSEELYGTRRNGTTPQAPLDTFAQGRDYDLLHLAVDTAGTGLVDLRVIDPAGQVRFNFTAAGPSSTHQEADLPALGGAWRVVWNVQGPIDAFLNIAGITVTEGNV